MSICVLESYYLIGKAPPLIDVTMKDQNAKNFKALLCITVIVEHVESAPQPLSGLKSINNVFTWNKSQQFSDL